MLVAILVLTTAAMAKKDDNQGKMGPNVSDTLENVTGPPREQGRGKLTQNRSGVGNGARTMNRTKGRGMTQNRTQVRNETYGALVSEIQQVRREQFRLMKDELEGLGYHGDVSDFAVAFNRQLKQLKYGIRQRFNSSEDSNLTRAVMRETARRELARVRQERLAGLNISEDEVSAALMNISGSNESFKEMVKSMSQQFRATVLGIVKNGTLQDKKTVGEQVRKYVSERNIKRGLLRSKVKIRRTFVRRMLAENRTTDEMFGSLSS